MRSSTGHHELPVLVHSVTSTGTNALPCGKLTRPAVLRLFRLYLQP
ncbi:hypothetical protein HMPREF3185_00438 [Porphyromonas somerae]|uniref:Uncharacterized protein n=1 Tax=Porphyromonas somerae TaxID=322095 RepID=A0A134BCM9_9PORP|nr:hypothetical protein HMPREF3184_00438 [Porphyromonadaceae bacterium KA00676]KXB77681.1 hypothetical protein HMPREF3185_00438 [Porphyromonas somerae]